MSSIGPLEREDLCMHVIVIVTDGMDKMSFFNFILCTYIIDICFWYSKNITQAPADFIFTKTGLSLSDLRSHGYRSEEIQLES